MRAELNLQNFREQRVITCAGNPRTGAADADFQGLLANHPVRPSLKKKERTVTTVRAKDGLVGEALLCKWGDLSLTSRLHIKVKRDDTIELPSNPHTDVIHTNNRNTILKSG